MSEKMKKCPFCGTVTLETRSGDFHFTPPDNILGGAMVIPCATWLECATCGEKIIPHALDEALDLLTCRRLGLLTPSEIQEIRKRTGLSAVNMAKLIGVGEKTYTRWESGKSFQNKSSDTLIRLLDRDAESFGLIEAERDPTRERKISDYFESLKTSKGCNPLAMAAHGADLNEINTESLRRMLQERIRTAKALPND